MPINDIPTYLIPVVTSLISGVLAFVTSTYKAKKDLLQLQEQNRHDIEKLVSQHKLDIEEIETRHKLDLEKAEIDHKHKIELLKTEMENQQNLELLNALGPTLINQVMKMPEIQNQIRNSIKNSPPKKH